MFLANYLIGLREGLEAALVVSILVAYLVRTGHRERLRWVWAGVGIAVTLSVAVSAALQVTSNQLSFTAQEMFGGVMSIIAVVFVTWMVFWMRKAARSIKGELEGAVDKALAMGAGAVVGVSFLAVAREGLETAVFVWSSVSNSTNAVVGFTGAVLGLTTSVVLGYLIYRGALRINLAKFFKITGVLLIIVAAGVLAYGVHDLQEAGFLPGLSNQAFDVSTVIVPASVLGTLLKGIFNFQPDPTVLQVVVWVTYLVPVLVLFLRSPKSPSVPAEKKDQPSSVAGA
ncbi:MAG: iron uptake transporter permease EfeU [Actinomycetes bacterium]